MNSKFLRKSVFISTMCLLLMPGNAQAEASRSSILQTDIVPYLESQDCAIQVQSSQDQLAQTQAELAYVESQVDWAREHFPCASACDSMLEEVRSDLLDTTQQLQTVESVLESTQDLFSQTETLLEGTRDQLSTTDSLLENTREELIGAHSVIDQATDLINYPSIPRASALDALISRLFDYTPTSLDSPLTDSLVQRIEDALIPYEQSALTKISPFRTGFSENRQSLDNEKVKRSSILQTAIVPYLESQDCENQFQSSQEQLVVTQEQLVQAESELEWLQSNCASLCESSLEETRNDLSETEQLLQTTESVLENTQDLFSQTESLLESTQEQLSETEFLLESTQEELASADSIIDQATDLINDPAIPNASELDVIVASIFGGNTALIEGSPSDPLVQRIDDALIPYLESALSKLTLPKQVESGDRFTIVLASNGKLYGCGRNNAGQLGIGQKGSNRLTLTAMNVAGLDGLPISITAGSSCSFVLTDNGKIYDCGRNVEGELGIGQDGIGSERLTLTAMDLSHIDGMPVMIRSYKYTILVLTDNGKVYGCGDNSFGQLGIGVTGSRNTLTAMNLSPLNGEIPISISEGDSHSLILTNSGKIYGCGTNSSGQLGLGSGGFAISYLTLTPMRTTHLDSLPRSISAGGYHSLVLTSTTIYGCGRNAEGQLGLGSTTGNKTTLTAMIQNFLVGDPRSIVAGDLHSLLLMVNGKIYGCGDNTTGQLGIGNRSARSTLTAMDLEPLDSLPVNFASGISSGDDPFGSQTFVMTENGKIYDCGFDYFGQLGIGQSGSLTGITTLTAMHDIEILPDMVAAVIRV